MFDIRTLMIELKITKRLYLFHSFLILFFSPFYGKVIDFLKYTEGLSRVATTWGFPNCRLFKLWYWNCERRAWKFRFLLLSLWYHFDLSLRWRRRLRIVLRHTKVPHTTTTKKEFNLNFRRKQLILESIKYKAIANMSSPPNVQGRRDSFARRAESLIEQVSLYFFCETFMNDKTSLGRITSCVYGLNVLRASLCISNEKLLRTLSQFLYIAS